MKRPVQVGGVLRGPSRLTSETRVLLCAMLLAVSFGFLAGRWLMPTLLVFLSLGLLIGTVWSHEFALGAVLVCVLLLQGLLWHLGLPVQVLLLPKVLVGLFALTVVLDLGPENPPRLPMSIVVLVVVLAVAGVSGTTSPFHALQSIVGFLAGPIAYVAIVHAKISIQSLRRLGLVVVAFMIAQLPLVLIESRVYGSVVDRIGGTFGFYGGTTTLAVMMAFAWTTALALLSGRNRIGLVLSGLAIAAVLLISEAKAGFFLSALGTVAVGVTRALASPRRVALVLLRYGLVAAIVLAAIIVGYAYFGSVLPGGREAAAFWVDWLTNPTTVTDYLFESGKGGEAGRLSGVVIAFNELRTIPDLLLGNGPGLMSSSALLGESRAFATESATTFAWATSAARVLLEAGILGMAAYLVAVGFAARDAAKAWASRVDDMGIRVAGAAVGSATVYIAAAFYTNPWYEDTTSLFFWCLMGIAVKWGRLHRAGLQPASDASAASGARPVRAAMSAQVGSPGARVE